MKVEVAPAAASEAEILRNLMSLYLHEFSDIDPEATGEVGEDGRFTNRYLDLYWSEPGRYPFLIRVDGRLAGFALVVERCFLEPGTAGHEVAEFFVLRTHRRRRVGERAAAALFERFPGPWWIAEHAKNESAQAFWRAVIGRHTAGRYEEGRTDYYGDPAVVQTFDCPPGG